MMAPILAIAATKAFSRFSQTVKGSCLIGSTGPDQEQKPHSSYTQISFRNRRPRQTLRLRAALLL